MRKYQNSLYLDLAINTIAALLSIVVSFIEDANIVASSEDLLYSLCVMKMGESSNRGRNWVGIGCFKEEIPEALAGIGMLRDFNSCEFQCELT